MTKQSPGYRYWQRLTPSFYPSDCEGNEHGLISHRQFRQSGANIYGHKDGCASACYPIRVSSRHLACISTGFTIGVKVLTPCGDLSLDLLFKAGNGIKLKRSCVYYFIKTQRRAGDFQLQISSPLFLSPSSF